MVAPTSERVERFGHNYYNTKITARWAGDTGPTPAEGSFPIEDCARIREIIGANLATRQRFVMQARTTWSTSGPFEEKEHHFSLTGTVEPQTLVNGDLARYTYANLLQAFKDEFDDLMENPKLQSSEVVFRHLKNVQVLTIVGRVLNAAAPLGKPLILRGGRHVKLPPCIAKKNATLNIQNDDEQCFRVCVLAWQLELQGVKNAERWPGEYVTNPRGGGPRPKSWKPEYKRAGLDFPRTGARASRISRPSSSPTT
jgi:hypothetical protein